MTHAVTLTIPADTAFVAMARSVAATMAAHADLTLDRLEDVRLAVDEAISQLIGDAVPGTDITCAFTVHEASLEIEISAVSASGRPPADTTFSWTVMQALVDSAASAVADGSVILRLQVSRAIPVQA